MTDKNANTEIHKEFCPNCEAETPCTHEAELFVCDICGEDFAKYIVLRNCNLPDVSITQDVLTSVKTPESIENTNPDYYKGEVHELHFTEALRNLAKRNPADVSAIGVSVLIDHIEELEKEIARRDEIITRLKEDAERLAATYVVEVFPHEWVCRGGCHHWARFGEQIDHAPDCPITLHRALMKELE